MRRRNEVLEGGKVFKGLCDEKRMIILNRLDSVEKCTYILLE